MDNADINELNQLLYLWVTMIIMILGAIGTLITVLVTARKTSIEATNLKNQQKLSENKQQKILDQFSTNGGSTMKDAVNRVEKKLTDILLEQSGMKKDIGRLADVDNIDREISSKESDRFFNLLESTQTQIRETQKQISSHIQEVPKILKDSQELTLKLLEDRKNDTKQ